VDPATKSRRRDTYEKWSAVPLFFLGMLFLVGIVEFSTGQGDTSLGVWLMAVAWVGFAADLVVTWWLDEQPRTFARRHAIGILAVLVPAFRALMVFYIFVRLARGRRRLQARVQLYALYLTILVVTFGAALVLTVERPYPGSNIQTYPEAVWWAAVTVTTVGYGDYVPVSPAGRALATLMLANGVIVISVITATIASRFVASPDDGERPVTLDDLDERLERLEAVLTTLAQAQAIAPTGATAASEGDPSPN
jgi:voltage-gated potassium channel